MPRTLPARPVNNSYDQTFDHRIRLYSAAAIATGVSMLALAQPAEGEVVITRNKIEIPYTYYGGAQHRTDRLNSPSLGMLALGAGGLALWRRDDTLASNPTGANISH